MTRPSRSATVGTPVVVLLIVVAACRGQDAHSTVNPSQPSTPASATSASAGVDTGLVRGTVVRPPGQDPRSGHSTASTVPVSGDPIHAYDPAGRLAATTISGTDGAFELVLPAGTYRLVEDICAVSHNVVVHARATAQVVVALPTAC